MVDALTPVNLAIAFAAGLVSFASPCMLPLVPGYVAFLGGPRQAHGSAARRISPRMRASLVFVASFAVVFTLMGMGASLLGGRILESRRALEIGAGVIIAVMGASMAFEPLMPMALRRRIGARLPTTREGGGLLNASLLGVAFAAAWSPCLGPALAAILTLAASQQHAASGGALLAIYALGLGVPFLIVAASMDRLMPRLRRLGPHLRTVQIASGVVLMAFGIAVATGAIGELSARLSGVGGFGI